MLPELNAEIVQLKMKMLELILGQSILKTMRKFITHKLKWVALFQQILTLKEKKKKSVKNFLKGLCQLESMRSEVMQITFNCQNSIVFNA